MSISVIVVTLIKRFVSCGRLFSITRITIDIYIDTSVKSGKRHIKLVWNSMVAKLLVDILIVFIAFDLHGNSTFSQSIRLQEPVEIIFLENAAYCSYNCDELQNNTKTPISSGQPIGNLLLRSRDRDNNLIFLRILFSTF